MPLLTVKTFKTFSKTLLFFHNPIYLTEEYRIFLFYPLLIDPPPPLPLVYLYPHKDFIATMIMELWGQSERLGNMQG